MTLPVRLGVCILPTSRWADSRATWIDLDIAGVDHLWTYDHLSWRDLRDGPWFGAMPLLTAVASVTSRAMVGPIVASPNYSRRAAAERQAMNAGIQGLAADIFKVALVRLDRAVLEGGYRTRLILQVHDEVILEVPPHEAEVIGALTVETLMGAAQLDVPLEVNVSWGASWAEAKG